MAFSLGPHLVAAGCILWAAFAHAALPPYLFANFETDAGWSEGPLPAVKSGLRLIQGEAAILPAAEKNSKQVLKLGPSEPFPAVFVETLPVATAPVVFCEFLVKPAAVDEQADAEFFDLGGAIIGFFRIADRGEIRALFSRSKDESVWISTGARFDLGADGIAAEWLRITVRLDRLSERWDLRINGVVVLAGLQAVEDEAAGLPLWLYGQESQPCQFDDLLVATVEPDQLEKLSEWEWQRSQSTRVKAGETRQAQPKLVSKARPRAEFRGAQPAIQNAARTLVAPVLRAWKGTLKIGETTYKMGPEVDIAGKKQSLLIYSPQYDEAGNPLPGVFTMTADAELRPGTDLGRIRWLMAEMKSQDDIEVFAAGDFSTGLVQSVTIPADRIRKATTSRMWVWPGNDDVRWWRFRMQRDTNLPPGQ